VGLRDFGPAMAPMNAFLTLTGCETLPLRMACQSRNAAALAAWLEARDDVAWVSHPSLASSPSHDLARKYLPDGQGAVFTFGLKGDGTDGSAYEAGRRTVESCRLFSHLANIGDTRSLIIHPASTTHRQLSADDRAGAGAGDEVIRISAGIENIEDLIADLDQALGGLFGSPRFSCWWNR
jgi:O-acetylhomoserine (thiol)-lyase